MYVYYYYDVISILCVQGGVKNLKLFAYVLNDPYTLIKYIELNVHLLVADGIERLFVGGIIIEAFVFLV